MLLHHLIEKLLVAVHMIIAHKAVRQLFEQLLRAVDLGFFDRTKIEAFHASLGLGNEVNVLDKTKTTIFSRLIAFGLGII